MASVDVAYAHDPELWMLVLTLSATLALAAPPPAHPGDLTITEFMADTEGDGSPAVPDYQGEWFEVHNNTDHTLDLQGVTVSSGFASGRGNPLYWGARESWPLGQIDIGSAVVQDEAGHLILRSTSTDPSVLLAQQVICTRLNVALGFTLSNSVNTALTDAVAWFVEHTDQDGVPPFADADTAALATATTLASTLSAFNGNVRPPGFLEITRSFELASNQYAVFLVNDDPALNGGVNPGANGAQVYEYAFAEMNLDGDNVDFLELAYFGTVLDTVRWNTPMSWRFTTNKSKQVDPFFEDLEWANGLLVNWCDASQFTSLGDGPTGQQANIMGTPGVRNDSCFGVGATDDADADGFRETDGDCDDTDPTVNPGEIDDAGRNPVTRDPNEADRAGRDDDCDGVRDDGETDDDGDGFTEVQGDCDDTPEVGVEVNPNGVEAFGPDQVDQDCNGCADDRDRDGDGFTDCDADLSLYDCLDSDEASYPGATEIPYDRIDQDCDGGDLCDVDGDGELSLMCATGLDCDDEKAEVNTLAEEVFGDGIDNDCDGVIDSPDRDGDGFAETDGDCMDIAPAEDPDLSAVSATVFPGAAEICGDMLDNDCDGYFDNLPGCVTPTARATVRGGGFCGIDPAAGPSSVGVLAALAAVVGARRRRGGAA